MFKRSILSATIASMLFFGGSMISVVQSAEVAIPVTILFMCLQRYYVEGVTGGAVKG